MNFEICILPLTRHILYKLFLLIFSNIEDIARDAGSIDVEEDVLFRKCCLTRIIFYHLAICINYLFVLFVNMKELQTELDNLCQSDRVAEADQLGIYKPLYEMIEVLISLYSNCTHFFSINIYTYSCLFWQGIISWIRRRKKSLGKHSFQHTASWLGFLT